jgi:hypothetical protein
MDMEGEVCLAEPIPQITSSGGKSLSQSGVVTGPAAVVGAGEEPQAAITMTASRQAKTIKFIFFINYSFILFLIKEHLNLTDKPVPKPSHTDRLLLELPQTITSNNQYSLHGFVLQGFIF